MPPSTLRTRNLVPRLSHYWSLAGGALLNPPGENRCGGRCGGRRWNDALKGVGGQGRPSESCAIRRSHVVTVGHSRKHRSVHIAPRGSAGRSRATHCRGNLLVTQSADAGNGTRRNGSVDLERASLRGWATGVGSG